MWTRMGGAMLLAAWLAGPALARDSVCQFQASGTLTLAFATLDPSAAAAATATATAGTVQQRSVGDCQVALAVGIQSSANFDGVNHRLRHSAGADYIPYTISVSYGGPMPPGNNRYYPITVQGSIAASSYVNATAGTYSDSVVVQVTP